MFARALSAEQIVDGVAARPDGPPDVVALVFQSPYAMKTIEELNVRALALASVGAFMHKVAADDSVSASDIMLSSEQIMRATQRMRG